MISIFYIIPYTFILTIIIKSKNDFHLMS